MDGRYLWVISFCMGCLSLGISATRVGVCHCAGHACRNFHIMGVHQCLRIYPPLHVPRSALERVHFVPALSYHVVEDEQDQTKTEAPTNGCQITRDGSFIVQVLRRSVDDNAWDEESDEEIARDGSSILHY